MLRYLYYIILYLMTEIKPAVRAMQAYELYGFCGILASRTTLEAFYGLIHYLQTVHMTLPTIFQSIPSVFRLIFFFLPSRCPLGFIIVGWSKLSVHVSFALQASLFLCLRFSSAPPSLFFFSFLSTPSLPNLCSGIKIYYYKNFIDICNLSQFSEYQVHVQFFVDCMVMPL